jgi:glycosyltransferase involved in cell wall biosynthesis
MRPPVVVLMRVLNGEPTLSRTLTSLVRQEYDGPVTIVARVDASTTDATEFIIKGYADEQPDWTWKVERADAHETLWTATRKEYERLPDGVLYTLDAGNRLATDRLTHGWDCHPTTRPVCVNRVTIHADSSIYDLRNVDGPVDVPDGPIPLPSFEELCVAGWYDTLCYRIDCRFAREVLAPLMGHTDEELGEDHFTSIIARHLDWLCAHMAYAGEYLVTRNSLDHTTHKTNPNKTAQVVRLATQLIESGEARRLADKYGPF